MFRNQGHKNTTNTFVTFVIEMKPRVSKTFQKQLPARLLPKRVTGHLIQLVSGYRIQPRWISLSAPRRAPSSFLQAPPRGVVWAQWRTKLKHFQDCLREEVLSQKKITDKCQAVWSAGKGELMFSDFFLHAICMN